MSLVYSQDTGGQSSPHMSSRSDDAELVITLKSRGRTNISNLNKVNESAGRQFVSINDDDSHHVTNLNYQVKQRSSTSVCNNSEQVIEESMLPMETPSTMSAATCSELLTKSDISDDDDIIRIKEEVDTSDDSECSSDVIVVSLDYKVGEKRKKILLSEEQHNQPMKKVRILPHTESMPSTSDMISSTTETMSSTSTNDDENLNVIQVDPAEFTIKRKVVHECVVCNEKFKSITELFSHRVEHNEKTPLTFRCSKCDATFSEPLDLEQHQLLHIENRAFQCSFCQETFTTLHNFKCHLRIHNTRGPLVCNMCYQVFDKKKQFISHMDDHAWGNSNIRICHQCTVCKKYFSDSSKLKRHMLRHYMGKPYKCEICPKDFLEKHKLTRHMLTHTGVKEHVCPHCDKAFTLRFNLATHLKIHGNERRFQCHVCKRTFVQKVVLQRHLRIHQDYINDVLDKGGAAS